MMLDQSSKYCYITATSSQRRTLPYSSIERKSCSSADKMSNHFQCERSSKSAKDRLRVAETLVFLENQTIALYAKCVSRRRNPMTWSWGRNMGIRDHSFDLTFQNIVINIWAQNDVCLANDIEGFFGCSSSFVNWAALTCSSILLRFLPDLGQDTNAFPERHPQGSQWPTKIAIRTQLFEAFHSECLEYDTIAVMNEKYWPCSWRLEIMWCHIIQYVLSLFIHFRGRALNHNIIK